MPSKMIAPTPTVRFVLAACLAVAAPMAGAQPPAPDVGAPGGAAFAADGPEAEPFAAAQPPSGRGRPDFLFGQPRGFAGFSAGWLRATSGGVFDWFRGFLISGVDDRGEFVPISERAYDTPLFRIAAGYSITPRVDLVFDVTPSDTITRSEYREWTNRGQPIAQSTQVWQIPLNAGVRYWVAPRGRRIGQLAWVPSAVAFHVGGGLGLRWYRLEQFGDFVDYTDLSIWNDRLQSRGKAFTRHVAAGISVRLSRRIFAVAEARRVWSQPVADDSFNFGDIDLGGLHMTGGFEFVF